MIPQSNCRKLTRSILILILIELACGSSKVAGEEPVTLANVEDFASKLGLDPDGRAGLSMLDEPYLDQFSLAAAKSFLDTSALYWQKKKNCFSCHTNFPYLMARPLLGANDTAHRQVRAFAEAIVSERWPAPEPNDSPAKVGFSTEVVGIAAALALNDAATTGKLENVTRTALDRMWTVLRDDGSFTWYEGAAPPSEIGPHYGVTMALIGVGAAPDGYSDTPQAKAGVEQLCGYLRNQPANSPHRAGMLLWAASYFDDLLTTDDRRRRIHELCALQHEDGGWSLASLGNWTYEDGIRPATIESDGYGTGFVIYVLRRSGVPADDPRIQSGIRWLMSNQRASGGWFTPSQTRKGRNSISRAGSALAILALNACDQIPGAGITGAKSAK